MEKAFRLDRSNAKIMGVCSGLSHSTGIDVTIIRIALVLITLFALGPVAVLAYLIAGWLAEG